MDRDISASQFAIELLVPEESLIHKVQENTNNGVVDIESIANYFGVSRSIILRRMIDLDLLN